MQTLAVAPAAFTKKIKTNLVKFAKVVFTQA
jgi:hypothetical protein